MTITLKKDIQSWSCIGDDAVLISRTFGKKLDTDANGQYIAYVRDIEVLAVIDITTSMGHKITFTE